MKIQSNFEYGQFLIDLKEKVKTSRLKAALSVNSQLITMYWEIGNSLIQKQKEFGWGSKIIDRLSDDLSNAFPEMKGFSVRNLKYMKKFAGSYPDFEFVQQVAAQIPWFHNCILIDKIKDNQERTWYINQTIQNGWSRNVLVMQIETNLYKRQVIAEKTTNFERTLPKYQSDLALQTFKDPYIFDFLNISDEAHEREIEKELINHIANFLLKLGAGFSFVGRQYHLEISGNDYYIDLLFYHLKLRCFVVIEIKAGSFKPEFAGKMNFYLSAVDDILKHTSDNDSIGLLLCKDKSKVIAEYAIRDINKPIGITEYRISEAIPENLKTSLPTIEELETELEKFNFENNEEKET